MHAPERTPWRLGRRGFLRLLAALGVAPLGAALRAGEGRPIERTVPASGVRLPAIGLGTHRAFDVAPDPAGLAPQREVLRRFFELGGRVVDTSPMYGAAEEVLGILARELDLADRLFWATKVWTTGRRAGIAEMERSFERLGTRTIGLMQVHNLLDWQTHLPTLRDWQAQRRFDHIGITHYRVDAYPDLERLILRERPDFVQLNYSIVTRDAELRLLPLCADHGVAVLVNQPFEKGRLFRRARERALPAWVAELGITSWAQLFLKFIVSHPAVTCAIPATSKPHHLEDNMAALRGPLPDATQRERLAAVVRDL